MKKILVLSLILSVILSSCKKDIDYSNVETEDIENSEFDPDKMEISNDVDVETYHQAIGEYPDGTYCAEVEYYNPNTGTRNTYDLDVAVEDGDLTVINWPNGGWLDDTHFSPENISSGEVQFTSDKGYQYTVTLGSFGGCGNSDEYKIRRDVNNDIEEEEAKNAVETCPECGF